MTFAQTTLQLSSRNFPYTMFLCCSEFLGNLRDLSAEPTSSVCHREGECFEALSDPEISISILTLRIVSFASNCPKESSSTTRYGSGTLNSTSSPSHLQHSSLALDASSAQPFLDRALPSATTALNLFFRTL